MRLKLASVSGLLAAALALGVNQVISHLWDRPRPFAAHAASTHLLSAPSPDPSFPSDHAAAAFAIAFAVFAFWRRGGIAFLATALVIALSRIALGLHYPSDVIAGALVGWTAALVVTRLGRPWLDGSCAAEPDLRSAARSGAGPPRARDSGPPLISG